jgi:hypothetical protein
VCLRVSTCAREWMLALARIPTPCCCHPTAQVFPPVPRPPGGRTSGLCGFLAVSPRTAQERSPVFSELHSGPGSPSGELCVPDPRPLSMAGVEGKAQAQPAG